jgi:hypothetical protein
MIDPAGTFRKAMSRSVAAMAAATAALVLPGPFAAGPPAAPANAPAPPRPAFSKRFDFERGRTQEVKGQAGPLRVEWVKADAAIVPAERAKPEGAAPAATEGAKQEGDAPVAAEGARKQSATLSVVVHLSNPTGRERRVTLKVTFTGSDGRVLAAARGEDSCEEVDDDDVELRVTFDGPLDRIAAFTLELDVAS